MKATETSLRIGLYNKNFQMASQEMLEEKIEQVDGKNTKFKLVAGPLIFQNEVLESTYMLEVHYNESNIENNKNVAGGNFGQTIYADYAEKAAELVDEFCEEKGFYINDIFNSWPVYQAIISRESEEQ